jgi:hypothetical protein
LGTISEDVHVLAADVETLSILHKVGFLSSGKIWRSVLLRQGLVFRRKGEDGWYISLGAFGLHSCVAWPAVHTEVASNRSWGFKKIASAFDLKVVCVFDCDEYEVVPTVWASPANFTAVLGGAVHLNNVRYYPLLQTAKALPLLEYAARQGFWDLKDEIVRKVASELCGKPPDRGASRIEVVVSCVKHVLKVKDAEVGDILEPWVGLGLSAEDEALLASEGAKLLICDSDRKVLEDMVSEASSCRGIAEQEALKIRELRGRKYKRRKPLEIPLDITVDVETLKGYAPPDSRLYRDMFNCCWRVWVGLAKPPQPRWSASSSWGFQKTDRECALEVLRRAWDRHTAMTGEPCPWSNLP